MSAWIWILGAFFIIGVVVGLAAISPVVVQLHYVHHQGADRVTIDFRGLWGSSRNVGCWVVKKPSKPWWNGPWNERETWTKGPEPQSLRRALNKGYGPGGDMLRLESGSPGFGGPRRGRDTP